MNHNLDKITNEEYDDLIKYVNQLIRDEWTAKVKKGKLRKVVKILNHAKRINN